jgi:hypothetical protein
MQLQQRISGITHPLIKDIYLKHGYANDNISSILVIETIEDLKGSRTKIGSSYGDLLADLPALQYLVEKQVGHLDEIDIRTH